MGEQRGPRDLVKDASRRARRLRLPRVERPLSPWLESQGHSPYAWTVLGAAAQATERIGLMTYVTCRLRYHPAVVAQKAATVACCPTAASGWASEPART